MATQLRGDAAAQRGNVSRLRDGIHFNCEALREPEAFALAWQHGERRYQWWVWLALTVIAGTLTYGMSMGILGGTSRVLMAGLSCTAAAGLAWFIPLPALYILNRMSGSRLPLSSTVLAALVTTVEEKDRHYLGRILSRTNP